MLFLPLALLASAASSLPTRPLYNTTHPTNSTTIPARLCGISEPSPALIDAHQTIRTSLHKRSSTQTRKYTVDTIFHIITTADQQNTITKSMIANQFGALQSAYASSSISFRLLSVDYHVNDTWATDAADTDMKTALRRGNYSTLNIYFQSNLSTSYNGASSQLLGYSTLPTNVTYSPCDGCDPAEVPAEDYVLDGCNIHTGTMPDGALTYYNQGKTAVHEVGHWFGLLHTFQDNSCEEGDPGDYIDDTPQESVSTDGCPVGKKSCPDCPGVDPIHNFMDYSQDSCYEGFTPEQIDRMQEMYGSLRLGE